MPETRRHEGDYLTLVEREQWLEEASTAIASFVNASRTGFRDQWFDESEYFNSQYHRELPDGEVIHDLLSAIRLSKGVGVYRCPQCRRVYIQEQSETNMWMTYEYVKTTGTP